jgi:hypothetical protein
VLTLFVFVGGALVLFTLFEFVGGALVLFTLFVVVEELLSYLRYFCRAYIFKDEYTFQNTEGAIQIGQS